MASRSRPLRALVFIATAALSAALVVGGAGVAAAGDGSVVPAGAVAHQSRLLTRIDAATRAKLPGAGKQVAGAAATTPGKSVEQNARDVVAALGVPPGMDIEALVFLVLMEAAKSADDDLRAIMSETKALNAIKACRGSKPCIAGLKPTADYNQSVLDATRAKIDRKDSLSDLGQELQTRMQMYQDARQKSLDALSNMLKKMSETSASIVGNMK